MPKEAETLIPAKKTGAILYYPRLENAEWTSTKQHQHGVPRAFIQDKGLLCVELAPKVHQNRHFTGSIQGGARGRPEKSLTPHPCLATPL